MIPKETKKDKQKTNDDNFISPQGEIVNQNNLYSQSFIYWQQQTEKKHSSSLLNHFNENKTTSLLFSEGKTSVQNLGEFKTKCFIGVINNQGQRVDSQPQNRCCRKTSKKQTLNVTSSLESQVYSIMDSEKSLGIEKTHDSTNNGSAFFKREDFYAVHCDRTDLHKTDLNDDNEKWKQTINGTCQPKNQMKVKNRKQERRCMKKTDNKCNAVEEITQIRVDRDVFTETVKRTNPAKRNNLVLDKSVCNFSYVEEYKISKELMMQIFKSTAVVEKLVSLNSDGCHNMQKKNVSSQGPIKKDAQSKKGNKVAEKKNNSSSSSSRGKGGKGGTEKKEKKGSVLSADGDTLAGIKQGKVIEGKKAEKKQENSKEKEGRGKEGETLLRNKKNEETENYEANAEQGNKRKFKIIFVKNRNNMFIGNYIITKKIGRGTFGEVCMGLHTNTHEVVAIKILNKQKLSQIVSYDNIIKEIEIHKRIDHSHICKLYEVYENEQNLYLILEHVSGGDLLTYIYKHTFINESECRRIFYQIVSAVHYLHTNNIVHRDLKPENILLDYNNDVNIIDFGLSTIYEENKFLTTYCGSPFYTSPEILLGNKYRAESVDVWSLGVILFLMLNRRLPFNDDEIKKLFHSIIKGILHFEPFISNSAKHLLQNMLNVNPLKRYTLKDIMSHPWFHCHNLKLYRSLSECTPLYTNEEELKLSTREKCCGLVDCSICSSKEVFHKEKMFVKLVLNKIRILTRLKKTYIQKHVNSQKQHFLKTTYSLLACRIARIMSTENDMFSLDTMQKKSTKPTKKLFQMLSRNTNGQQKKTNNTKNDSNNAKKAVELQFYPKTIKMVHHLKKANMPDISKNRSEKSVTQNVQPSSSIGEKDQKKNKKKVEPKHPSNVMSNKITKQKSQNKGKLNTNLQKNVKVSTNKYEIPTNQPLPLIKNKGITKNAKTYYQKSIEKRKAKLEAMLLNYAKRYEDRTNKLLPKNDVVKITTDSIPDELLVNKGNIEEKKKETTADSKDKQEVNIAQYVVNKAVEAVVPMVPAELMNPTNEILKYADVSTCEEIGSNLCNLHMKHKEPESVSSNVTEKQQFLHNVEPKQTLASIKEICEMVEKVTQSNIEKEKTDVVSKSSNSHNILRETDINKSLIIPKSIYENKNLCHSDTKDKKTFSAISAYTYGKPTFDFQKNYTVSNESCKIGNNSCRKSEKENIDTDEKTQTDINKIGNGKHSLCKSIKKGNYIGRVRYTYGTLIEKTTQLKIKQFEELEPDRNRDEEKEKLIVPRQKRNIVLKSEEVINDCTERKKTHETILIPKNEMNI